MISKKLFTLIFISLIIQSCSYNNLGDRFKKTDCNNSKQEIDSRLNLFKELSKKELKRRKNIKLPSVSSLEDESVFSKIVNAIKNGGTPMSRSRVTVAGASLVWSVENTMWPVSEA